MKPSVQCLAQTKTQNYLLICSPPTYPASLNPSSGHDPDSNQALGNTKKITFLSLWMMSKGRQPGKKGAPFLLLVNKQSILCNPRTFSESHKGKSCDFFWGQDMRKSLLSKHPEWKSSHTDQPGTSLWITHTHSFILGLYHPVFQPTQTVILQDIKKYQWESRFFSRPE